MKTLTPKTIRTISTTELKAAIAASVDVDIQVGYVSAYTDELFAELDRRRDPAPQSAPAPDLLSQILAVTLTDADVARFEREPKTLVERTMDDVASWLR